MYSESHAQCWNVVMNQWMLSGSAWNAEMMLNFSSHFSEWIWMFSTIFWCSVLFCSVAHMSIGVLFSLLIGQLLFMLDTGKVRVLFSLFMLDTTFVLLDTAFVLLEFCSACSFDTIARVLIRCYLNFGERSYWTGLFIYDACSWLTLSNDPDHRWVWDTSS